ncbi:MULTISPECIES: hypothetical protein [unclassified Microbacterium]|uniref:hypothetical protein n=1 Tax=unclassified Microbacterium TaxID=2609290 RepID=UPI000C5744E5|nr:MULTISPECIES: hypothetical protein [unclassified Microbacterium]MBU21293.1 hypothetical protein [Microbacterium sp.]HBU42501.1 hypothetical protein [Microbacterium sp.]|tara:strand:- start:12670 stop:13008 length:339 start_codon:yes stop_codon:yes gene_type:complete
MLGYDAYVHEVRCGVSGDDLRRIGEIAYEGRTRYLGTLLSRRVAYVPYRTWVDKLLSASEDGRVELLQDGGYPYLFHARGEEIKSNFSSAGVSAIAALSNDTWYLVEAWDQS